MSRLVHWGFATLIIFAAWHVEMRRQQGLEVLSKVRHFDFADLQPSLCQQSLNCNVAVRKGGKWTNVCAVSSVKPVKRFWRIQCGWSFRLLVKL